MNLLKFAENATTELDKAIVEKTVTGFFGDNGLRAKFVGAKTVLVPEIDMCGLGDYDRNSGFVRGSVSVGNRPYTLSMERSRSFSIDREDEDESGIPGLAGEVMGEFVRLKVVPEIDAYVLSKLAGTAATRGNTVAGTLATQPFKIFTDAVNRVQNVAGYDEPLVAFLNSAMWSAFQTTNEIARQITVSDFQKGEVSTKVKIINGVALLPVPDNRMKTAYEFYNGIDEGQEQGGFAPYETAQSIALLVLPKRAASIVKKTEKVRTFSPEQNQNADAWKFDYRLYYDLLVKNSMMDTICAHLV